VKNFKSTLLSVALGIVLVSEAKAETKKQTITPVPAETAVTASEGSPLRMMVGPSLAVFGGSVGLGVGASVLYRVQPSLFVGLETGAYRWSASGDLFGTTVSATLWSIPLQATALYRFDLPQTSVHPYIGASLGGALAIASASGAGVTGSGSKVFFNGTVRPGVEIDLTPTSSLYVEPKFGLLSDEFIFLPQVGISFSL
jgi:hypothetical protein